MVRRELLSPWGGVPLLCRFPSIIDFRISNSSMGKIKIKINNLRTFPTAKKNLPNKIHINYLLS